MEQAFASWLSEQSGGPARVEPFTAPSAGMSNDTLLTTADWGGGPQPIVVRLTPQGRGIFPSYDLGAQVDLLRRLATTEVPVPEVLWYEPDPAPLGRPFFVMRRVEGRIPPDGHHFAGWVLELPADEQRAVSDAAVDVLARVHRVPVPAAPADAVAEEIARWRAYLDWAADGDRLPWLSDALEQVAAGRPPAPAQPGQCWGDARLGNLVYDGRLRVAAVLDWEMAVAGPGELDLGWYLFLDRTALQYTQQLPGFPSRDELVQQYETAQGRAVEHLDWYEAWAGVRAALIQVPLATTPEGRERNPVTKALRSLLR